MSGAFGRETRARPRLNELVKGRDSGGFRWALEGRKVNAGTGLQMAIPTQRVECPEDCDWDWNCPTCHGDGRIAAGIVWVSVRLEASDVAWVYMDTASSTSDGCRFAESARFQAVPGMIFRWPAGAADRGERGVKVDRDWERI